MSTRDSLNAAMLQLGKVWDDLAAAQDHYVAGVDSTVSDWDAYASALRDTLRTTRESLAWYVAASDSLGSLADSLKVKLDQATSLAWTLAHGRDVASRQEARRAPDAKDKARAKTARRKIAPPADTASVAVHARFAGHGSPIRPGLRRDGDINPPR